MDLKRYNLAECRRLLDDEEFWSQESLPTSRLRMASYVNNPRATDDDTLLYTVHKDGRLVSYIAVLPDFMRTDNDGKTMPFGWPSTWWAAQDGSLGPAASMLLFKVLSDWPGGSIALSGFSQVAKEVYDASRRFKDLKVFDMHAYAVELPSEFKGRRIPAAPFNALLRFKNRFYSSRSARSPVEWTVVDDVDADTDAFITTQTQDDLFPRDGALFNWLIKYPWLRTITPEDRKPGSEMQRYHFSGYVRRFQQLPVKLERDGKVIGFLLFTLKDDFLIVKYAIYPRSEAQAVKECVQAAALHYGATFLWCADDYLNTCLRGDRMFYVACKRVPVPFYIGKQMEYDTSARLHYGLGDRVMT